MFFLVIQRAGACHSNLWPGSLLFLLFDLLPMVRTQPFMGGPGLDWWVKVFRSTLIVWAKMKTFNHDESYHSNILFRLWRQTFLIVLVTVLGFKWNRSYLCLVRMSQNIQPLLWKLWAFNYSLWRSYHGTLGVPFSWEQAWAAWRPSNSAGLHVQVLGISTVCVCVYVYHVC